MPTNRLAYTKTSASQPASEGMLPAINPSNYGNATTKVINLYGNNRLGDSVVFTVDSAWRYVVHIRNTNHGASSIHIDDVRVYGKNTASYLLCGSGGEGYRFGFGNQEKENDISGVDGGHLAYKYRFHDARLGRFLSVDPLAREFPWNSPYAFAENDVIRCIDLEGKEKLEVNGNALKLFIHYGVFKEDGGPEFDVVSYNELIKDAINNGVNGTYTLDEDISIVADDGTSAILKKGIYTLEVHITATKYDMTFEEFMRDSPDSDLPEYSGSLGFNTTTRRGNVINFNDSEVRSVALTNSNFLINSLDVILFKSSAFEGLNDKNSESYNEIATMFKNAAIHETLIHDIGLDHEKGVYGGGIGNYALKDKLNIMTNGEFKGLFLKQKYTFKDKDTGEDKVEYYNRIRSVDYKENNKE